MWNFLFLVFTPISQRNRRGRGGGGGGGGVCVEVASFPNIGTCLPWLLSIPTSRPQPPQPHPDSTSHAFVVPFPFAKDGDQRASIVYCSSVMVWKQPSAEAFDICGHINQGCHTACLPSLPPQPHWIPSVPLTSAHAAPILSPDLLSLTWMCVSVSSSNASSPNGSSPFQSSERRI